MTRRLRTLMTVVTLALLMSSLAVAQEADPVPPYDFAGPIFGIAGTGYDGLFVADSGAGIVNLDNGQWSLIAELPGVVDVAPFGQRDMFAITGGGEEETSATLFHVSGDNVRSIANLGAFEEHVNPAGDDIHSNPFEVVTLWGKQGNKQALVADAGANALLIVDQQGRVDWIATLPTELVSTAYAKELAGCPTPPEEFAEVCELPEMIPAQAVATSVTIGRDGAYYVGELKGFPGPTEESRIWRIAPGTRHAQCGNSPKCTIVADGFTSIIDLKFTLDGTLYVVELDEAGWLAVELGKGTGGTVNACRPMARSWNCRVVATDLSPNPTSVSVINRTGRIYVSLLDFSTFQSQVTTLP